MHGVTLPSEIHHTTREVGGNDLESQLDFGVSATGEHVHGDIGTAGRSRRSRWASATARLVICNSSKMRAVAVLERHNAAYRIDFNAKACLQ